MAVGELGCGCTRKKSFAICKNGLESISTVEIYAVDYKLLVCTNT